VAGERAGVTTPTGGDGEDGTGVLPSRGERSDGRPAIGERLKAVRQAQRRTLSEVAEGSGLTKGFLSRLERDQANASVAALMRVCATLRIPIGSLFAAPPRGEVVRSGAWPRINFGGQGLNEYMLTPQGERRLQVILSDVAPGGGSGAEPYVLPSQIEFAYVCEGRLEVTFEDETTVLGPGDAYTFSPTAHHSFRSLEEHGTTRVLWVLHPALGDDFALGGQDGAVGSQDGAAG
jgi:transcriptional regulator with XRE-family HTH domain